MDRMLMILDKEGWSASRDCYGSVRVFVVPLTMPPLRSVLFLEFLYSSNLSSLSPHKKPQLQTIKYDGQWQAH